MPNIEFRQLTPDFYAEHQHLVEIIDKGKDGKITNKGRGYGVLLVDVYGYKFAIPLRSRMHINHTDNFTTKIYRYNGKRVRHGLDYSKAVIITEMRFVSKAPFFLADKSDFVKISKSEHIIIAAFEKYVTRYIRAVQKEDKNILRRYKYSTLQNYHRELGLIKQESNL
ncbi:type III toxin-antitoxin system TenpIN family toxin [Bacillus smithii]|uniref:Uncharacterized protein n=1 Tax=Bacillus smithii 7_3_47FAA TaxID=665952 RepID=G9QHQ1_9BACI|nr:hypothetical protein [Bacillus smithii]EHL79324.1 hypothetical protein HMPREF1015_03110 [Bacillus smithii 7_3_47FAA]